MGVIVVEPGEEGASRQVHHPRLRPDFGANIVIRADASDAIADNRDGLGRWLAIVDREHIAIQKDEIGGHGASRGGAIR